MTDNEKIARWRGAIETDWDSPPSKFPLGAGLIRPSGVPYIVMMIHPVPEGPPHPIPKPYKVAHLWQPDIDITLWHSEDGLLAEIEKRGIVLDFIFQLQVALQAVPSDEETHGDVALLYWVIRRAEPVQLAAALVKVIDDD